jgi:hypothetical protein
LELTKKTPANAGASFTECMDERPDDRSGRGHQARPTKSKSAEIPKLAALIKTKVHASDPLHFPYLRANGPINPSPRNWLLSHLNMEACPDFRAEIDEAP